MGRHRLRDGLDTIKSKPGWTAKDYEEREIPIPDFLVAALKERMLRTKGKLIFPNTIGTVNGHLIRIVPRVAKRAGIRGEATLHKWRKTFATQQHRNGLDARTILRRLGHSDLSTTKLAYLEGEDSRSDRSRDLVNSTFGVYAVRAASAVQ